MGEMKCDICGKEAGWLAPIQLVPGEDRIAFICRHGHWGGIAIDPFTGMPITFTEEDEDGGGDENAVGSS